MINKKTSALIFILFLLSFFAFGANQKISQLTPYPESSWTGDDLFPIVDTVNSITKSTRITDFDTRYFKNSFTTDNLTEGATNLYFTTVRARSAISATSPLTYSLGVLGCQAASGSQAGCLSSADWSVFNGKQNALSFGNLTDAGTDGITVTGGTGAVIGSGAAISQHVADSTHNGYLLQTDWSTFNGKQASGNYLTALTSDVSASGPGSVAATVNLVGGSSAATVHSAELLANAATSANTVSTIVRRDGSGNVAVGTATASQIIDSGLTASTVPYADGSKQLTSSAVTPTELGYVSGVTSAIQTQINSKQATGSYVTALTSDVSATGPGSVAATVNSVGGSTAANVHTAELSANAATNANTASTIVKRDGSGNFAAGTITGSQIIDSGLTPSTVPYADGSSQLTSSSVTPTELSYVSGVTSALQTQINGKQATGSYITALTSDVSASGPGSASATVNTVGGSSAANVHTAELAANAATSTATASTIAKRNASGQVPYDSLGSLPVNQVWNVDGTRVDSYTADGSIARPYKTIMAAENAIIANGLNAANHPDMINILSPTTYVENVTFNNAALFNIILNGNGATIAAASGTDIDSSATNTQLATLIINNINATTINLVGDVNGTNFLSNQGILNSIIANSLTVQNVEGVVNLVGDWTFTGNVAVQNMKATMGIMGGRGIGGTFTLTHDNASNKPAGLGASGTLATIEKSLMASTVTVTAGATLQAREGSRIGGSGGSCSISGTLLDFGATYRCNMTVNSGGTWTPSGSALIGTLTNSGTVTASAGTPYFKSFVGDSGSGGTQGIVPAPASGDAAANKFLKSSGSFVTPTSTMVTNSSSVAGADVTTALNTISTATQEILLVAVKNGGAVTANTEIPTWTSVSKDTNSAFNSTSGTFTVPVAGDYRVSFNASTTIGTPNAQVYYNGALYQTGVGSLTRVAINTVIPNTAVGDTIWVAIDTTGTLTSTNTDNLLQIQGLSGITTGIVNARYHGATATITGSLSNVTFSTSDFDTNSAYSGATYTCPSGGLYYVNASLAVTAATMGAGTVNVLQLNKNGSQYGNFQSVTGGTSQKPQILVYRDLVKCALNDTLVIQVSSTATTPTVTASNFLNFLSVMKVSN